jgi:hypothetical protein
MEWSYKMHKVITTGTHVSKVLSEDIGDKFHYTPEGVEFWITMHRYLNPGVSLALFDAFSEIPLADCIEFDKVYDLDKEVSKNIPQPEIGGITLYRFPDNPWAPWGGDNSPARYFNQACYIDTNYWHHCEIDMYTNITLESMRMLLDKFPCNELVAPMEPTHNFRIESGLFLLNEKGIEIFRREYSWHKKGAMLENDLAEMFITRGTRITQGCEGARVEGILARIPSTNMRTPGYVTHLEASKAIRWTIEKLGPNFLNFIPENLMLRLCKTKVMK